jgi:hypothetical protein
MHYFVACAGGESGRSITAHGTSVGLIHQNIPHISTNAFHLASDNMDTSRRRLDAQRAEPSGRGLPGLPAAVSKIIKLLRTDGTSHDREATAVNAILEDLRLSIQELVGAAEHVNTTDLPRRAFE